jgi:protocatechuate 3,4-dioxygenase beta subunit
MARDLVRNLATVTELTGVPEKTDLALQPGLQLSGHFVDIKGTPLHNIPVDLDCDSLEHILAHSSKPPATDAQGAFSVPALPQGLSYTVSNGDTVPGYGTARASLKPEETRTSHHVFPAFVLKLANRKLAGQVFGEDGQPVMGAKVSLSGTGQPRGKTDGVSVETDAWGHFSFDGVCDGPIEVTAAKGRWPDTKEMQVIVVTHGGDTGVLIRFALNGFVWIGTRTVTTSGRVLDPSGAPVAHALLWCVDPYGEVKSDAMGKYSMTWIDPGRPFWICAQDLKHHLAVSCEITGSTTDLDIHLQQALTLSAKVQDTKGEPIMSAQNGSLIFAITEGNQRVFWPLYDTHGHTDNQGIFQIGDLPPGGHYSFTLSAPGYGAVALDAQPSQTSTNHFAFPPVVLKASNLKLTGRVLNFDGTPMSGIQVDVGGVGQNVEYATTDAQGRFTFNSVCAGPIQISADANRNNSARMAYDLTASTSAQGGDSNAVIQFAINGSVGIGTRLVTTTGRVLDPSGSPVPGTRIASIPLFAVSRDQQLKSGPDGNFSLTWISGTNVGGGHLWIEAQDFKDHLAASHELADTTHEIDLRLRPALTLSVKVLDANGKPIPSAQGKDLRSYADGKDFCFYAAATTFNGEAYEKAAVQADVQGGIQIGDLPPGEYYKLTVSAPGYGWTSIEVQPNETKTSLYEFPPVVLQAANLKLAGRIVDTDGNPIVGIEVRLQGEGQPRSAARSDVQGRFHFDAACVGPAELFVTNPGFRTHSSRQIETEGGAGDVVVRLY